MRQLGLVHARGGILKLLLECEFGGSFRDAAIPILLHHLQGHAQAHAFQLRAITAAAAARLLLLQQFLVLLQQFLKIAFQQFLIGRHIQVIELAVGRVGIHDTGCRMRRRPAGLLHPWQVGRGAVFDAVQLDKSHLVVF